MIIESESGGERRWGRVISVRRLRAYGDDANPYGPIDFTAPYTEPANYVETDPAGAISTDSGLPQSTWDQFPSEVNPNAPAQGTGLSTDQYSSLLKAAQAAAQATGAAILAATKNANGTVSCPAGYIYDPTSRQCYPRPGGLFGLDTNTLLMIGAGGLGLLAIFYLLK